MSFGRQLLILDVDGTLAANGRYEYRGSFRFGDEDDEGRWIRRRPCANIMIDRFSEQFDVAIWSMGHRDWVRFIVSEVLGFTYDEFLFVWDADGSETGVKAAEKVIEEFEYEQRDIGLMDDVHYHLFGNEYPGIYIPVPEFQYECESDPFCANLVRFMSGRKIDLQDIAQKVFNDHYSMYDWA